MSDLAPFRYRQIPVVAGSDRFCTQGLDQPDKARLAFAGRAYITWYGTICGEGNVLTTPTQFLHEHWGVIFAGETIHIKQNAMNVKTKD
jgi:hypothetical protein